MLSNLNSIIIEGNLTRDPILKQTPNGTSVVEFSVASNRYWGKGEDQTKEVSYFTVEAWSKLAETCGTVLTKGRGVRVVGRLKQDRWTNNNGVQSSRIKIVAEHVEFKPVYKKAEAPTDYADDKMEQEAEEQRTAETWTDELVATKEQVEEAMVAVAEV